MILSIDCGTTNLKAALFDDALRRVAEEAVPVEYLVFTPEQVECDAEKIWQALVALIRQVCAAAKIDPVVIRTIALGSQAQTFTVLDPQGRPLVPFIGWPDKRPVAEAQVIGEKLGAGFHRHCSVAPPLAQLTLAKLLWLKNRDASLLAPANRVVLLPTFFALRLAGLNITDPNLAAMDGRYSLARGIWWTEALALCGLTADQMSTVVDTGRPVRARTVPPELGLSPDLEIVLAGNDQTAGAYGNGCGPGHVLVTLGTALVAYRYAGTQPGPYQDTAFWGPYPGGGYYELATRDEGCTALDWAVRGMLGRVPNEEFMKLAAQAPLAADACFYYPQRWGEPDAWVGEGDQPARARAVVEGISFTVRELIEGGLGVAHGSAAEITVIGGGSRHPFWRQMLADVLGSPVRRGGGDSLLGAAWMVRPEVTPPADASGAPMVPPDETRARRYDRRYRAWLAAGRT
ncbi:FGGY-family carbohydrate kinase [bacterium]|nr:FGGY-family carbohydrate kinase [bacterium]